MDRGDPDLGINMGFVRFKKAPKSLPIVDKTESKQTFDKGFFIGLWLGATIATFVWLM